MRKILLTPPTPDGDGVYLVHDEAGNRLGAFYPENDGWWYGARANGTAMRLWEPSNDANDVARRLFR